MDYPSSLQQEGLATSTVSHTLPRPILPFTGFSPRMLIIFFPFSGDFY